MSIKYSVFSQYLHKDHVDVTIQLMTDLKILYEDTALIVIDKPSGLLVIPSPKGETNTLTHFVNEYLQGKKELIQAYPCHRIDRETSGIVVFAKGKKNQQTIMLEFQKHQVQKTYLAFVHGQLNNKQGEIKIKARSKYDRVPQLMWSTYQVLQFCPAFTVVEVEPITGRTHQIRVQFKQLGHSLVGESLYAFRKDFPLRFKRLALHAAEITFTHPQTQRQMNFTSPLPPDMEKFLAENS